MNNADEWMSENDAHRVLARAVELDARDVLDVSLAQLREVAREAGIGESALDRAIQELKSGDLPHARSVDAAHPAGADSQSRPLSTRLARFRRHAASLILFGVATATPGDTFVPLMLYSIPLYALYEAVIRFYRTREGRGGRPPEPLATTAKRAQDRAARPAADQITRALLLRPA
jgi:hypothetical protein